VTRPRGYASTKTASLPLPGTEGSPGQPSFIVLSRFREWYPTLAALLTWLACLPVAWAVGSFGSANPWVLRTAMIPLAVAVAGVVIVGFVARRWHSDLVAGIGAGLLAGWAAFTLRLALHGTPYGFDGLGGDAGRPIVASDPEGTVTRSYLAIAEEVARNLAGKPN